MFRFVSFCYFYEKFFFYDFICIFTEMIKTRPIFCLLAASILFFSYSCEKQGNEIINDDSAELEELDDEGILKLVDIQTTNTAYYKDIFLDGGCELNPGIKENGVVINGRLPYALKKAEIGEAEYFFSTINDVADGYIESDRTIQNNLISGTSADVNGVLLYPDGEPRFRLFYAFGGHSGPHGSSLGTNGRLNVNRFYTNGGSYVGSCAGAYLAGKYASGKMLNYFNIWKGGNMKGTGVGNSSIEIEIVTDIFQDYYGPSYTTLVSDVRHNGGGYMDVNMAPEGTEILGRFLHQKGKNSSSAGFYAQPAIWAYKESPESGRLVVTGSHPEDASSGNILNMTASMFRYAKDGSGIAKVKGVLKSGEPRYMTKGTTDQKPLYTAIGDLQCHHFVIYLRRDAESLKLDLQGKGDYELELYLKKGAFAFPEKDPDYSSKEAGNHQTITTGPLEKGLWYVTVRCASTVTATETIIDKTAGLGHYYSYSGNTGVLNGVPYTIVANW